MKILLTTVLLSFIQMPLALAEDFDDTDSLYEATRARQQKNIEDSFDDPYKSEKPSYFYETPTHKDDKRKSLNSPTAKNQLDTWGRGNGQTMSSEDVLHQQLSPAH